MAEADRIRRERGAFELWLKCRSIAGTPAQNYLSTMPGRTYLPTSPQWLRFRDDVRHPQMLAALKFPVLFAAMVKPGAGLVGLMRHYLGPAGLSLLAEVDRPLLAMGSIAGAACPVAPRPSSRLVIVKGLTEALRAAALYPETAVWAVFTAQCLGALEVPAEFDEVMLAVGGEGPQGQAWPGLFALSDFVQRMGGRYREQFAPVSRE